MRRAAFWLCSLALFVLLCTLNSAMYRYGASDQAFYQPSVILRLHPEYFPRDASLLLAQARLTGADEVIGALSSVTRASLPVLFAVLYVGSLLLLALAAWLIAGRLYRETWTGVALLAALTLRHSIWRTGTNTLEGYFHPRQLAFGFGALAMAAALRRRFAPAAAAIVLAALVHPTTATWFAIWLTVAVFVSEARWRLSLAAAVLLLSIAALWSITAGPLADRLARMDPEWLSTLASKDYLFPLEWPAAAWIINLLPIPVIIAIYQYRRRAGLVQPVETGLAIGAVSLAAVFAAILPFNAARIALAVQLQSARMFWMLDFMATIYVVWGLAEGRTPSRWRAPLVAAILVVLSTVRGLYIKVVEFPERPVAQFNIRADDWGRAMAWARGTDPRSGWLADPAHAIWYGTSVRVAAERDVFVEAVKDAAIGMYDRDVAIRTRDRIAAAGDFRSLTPDRARALGAEYRLDYLIADRALDLPIAFQSGDLRIYRLR